MKRLRVITKPPGTAQSVTLDVILTYVANLIEITIPLVQDKDPQNPSDDTST